MSERSHHLPTRRELIRNAALGCLLALSVHPASKSPASSAYPENDDLSDWEINDRNVKILHTYGIGDILSASDADFISRYCMGNNNGRASWLVSGERYFNSHTYELRGNSYATEVSTNAYHFGGVLQAGCATSVSQLIQLHMYAMCYAVNGLSYELVDTFPLMYEGTNRNWYASEFFSAFAGVFATVTTACWASIQMEDDQVIQVSGYQTPI